jgi:multicomponent K+:H+ antiporter subunit D
LGRIVSFSVVASTGLLFMALGLRIDALTAPVLLYLASSVLATGAFFMVNGLAQRTRTLRMREAADVGPLPDDTYIGFDARQGGDPLSPRDEVGVAIPAAMVFLGLAFVCCVLLVAGLPPLSGFLAKFVLLRTAIGAAPSAYTWVFCAAVLVTGVAATIALTRAGSRLFWSVVGRTTPRLRLIEAGPPAFLILLCLALTVGAGPVMMYLESAAQSLHSPQLYIRVVNDTQQVAP